MILDVDLTDVDEAILEAFAAAGSDGLTAAEVLAACHRFDARVVERRLGVLRDYRAISRWSTGRTNSTTGPGTARCGRGAAGERSAAVGKPVADRPGGRRSCGGPGTQRAERQADLTTARLGLTEAEQTCHAHRASLALGIKNTLRQVALAFDEGQRMGSYNLKANTAQIDEKAAKLVCAAALAAGGDRPLVLILDELGRNLGKQHRREAVALFERIGRDRNVTVIGALQDDMERYALEASGLYIKLRRSSDAIAYNEPPVVVGDETGRARVGLLAQWLSSCRPAAEPDLEHSSEPDDPLTDFG